MRNRINRDVQLVHMNMGMSVMGRMDIMMYMKDM